uniref:Major facilitator superfamily (MFS) profile domain-containing protein n=1 Tax=Ananas comosus var. bracteatus TaxID=296719 RepID=A0A6V7PE33_ANACO|nr:unnamed protein product [Ananas comosus var. bracteatus]
MYLYSRKKNGGDDDDDDDDDDDAAAGREDAEEVLQQLSGLQAGSEERGASGDPVPDFFYIWLVTLCSTLPIQSVFPFLYFMIRDLHIAKQEEDIGFYAGLLVRSTYMFGRALTSVLWGVVADKYGRKPVIVISILSVIIVNSLFGLSSSYWMAITTRALLDFCAAYSAP